VNERARPKYGHRIAEILLKLVLNTNQSTEICTKYSSKFSSKTINKVFAEEENSHPFSKLLKHLTPINSTTHNLTYDLHSLVSELRVLVYV
jgi:hypothetical protein